MVKTKKKSAPRKSANKSVGVVNKPVKQTACEQACWLCWLFKLMIALFIVMIVFWLGFCFGALSAYTPGFKAGDKQMTTGRPVYPATMMDNATFNKEFLLQMIVHHQEAIAMAKMALIRTTDEGIQNLCQEIIDQQTAEIEELESQIEDSANLQL